MTLLEGWPLVRDMKDTIIRYSLLCEIVALLVGLTKFRGTIFRVGLPTQIVFSNSLCFPFFPCPSANFPRDNLHNL